MNPLDILIIVLLGYGLIRGFFRGLVKELASIVGVIAGYFAAIHYFPVAAGYLKQWISDPAYLNIISFMLIFIGVCVVVTVLGIIIKYFLKVAYLGWADRILGIIFGFVKSVLIVAVLLMALTTFLPKSTPIVKESVLAPHVSHISQKLVYLIPKDLRNKYLQKFKELQRNWKLPT